MDFNNGLLIQFFKGMPNDYSVQIPISYQTTNYCITSGLYGTDGAYLNRMQQTFSKITTSSFYSSYSGMNGGSGSALYIYYHLIGY